MVNLIKDLVHKGHSYIVKTIKWFIKPAVLEIITNEVRFYGDPQKIKVSPTAHMVNTLFNTSGGMIFVGNYTFTGHNVSLITGTHNYKALLSERMLDAPAEGRNITIGEGVWLGSGSIILGPCSIEDYAVVAAGAVVLPGTIIKCSEIYGGVPAKFIKTIDD